ncbi:MAG: hypothetical protein FWB78_12905 [Treponema sp.]|nr:hypothetical protein [Treponema sp.]
MVAKLSQKLLWWCARFGQLVGNNRSRLTAGEETRLCQRCDEFETRPIYDCDIYGPIWGEWEIITPPTAAGPGEKKRVCQHCGKHETHPVYNCDLHGHIWSEWEVITPPTETETGEGARTCPCGKRKTRPAHFGTEGLTFALLNFGWKRRVRSYQLYRHGKKPVVGKTCCNHLEIGLGCL